MPRLPEIHHITIATKNAFERGSGLRIDGIEKEKRCHSPDVKQSHKYSRDPVNFVFCRLRFFEIL